MDESRFSKWAAWADREKLEELTYPGIYALALSKVNLSGRPFSWIKEIMYVGMTNSKGGLKSRLKQFDNTIRGKTGHGGAQRFRYDFPNNNNIQQSLYPILYVSVVFFKLSLIHISEPTRPY